MNTHVDYWSEYYAAACSNNLNHVVPSQFAAFCAIEAKELEASTLIDIASGDGRDSIFFAQLGFEVRSLEKSDAALQIIKSRSREFDKLTAIRIDVTNEQLPQPGSLDGACIYYARFFLHTLTEPQLRRFFKNLSNAMHSSQYFFTEYRNDKDSCLTKYTPDHNRFFYKAKFIKTIAEVNKLKCVYDVEGRGFAKWKTDDAFVTRQIYVKS